MATTARHAGPTQVGVLAPALIAWGLNRLIESAHPAMALAMTWASVQDALERPAPRRCEIVVIDLGVDESLEAIARLHMAIKAPLLLITGSTDPRLPDRAIHCGARGVLQKAAPAAVLLKAIEHIARAPPDSFRPPGGRVFLEVPGQAPAPATGLERERDKIATLTVRERRTICAMASDASATGKTVAARLCISEHTLRNQLTSIYQKLGLTNRVDLFAYAMRNGLADPAQVPLADAGAAPRQGRAKRTAGAYLLVARAPPPAKD